MYKQMLVASRIQCLAVQRLQLAVRVKQNISCALPNIVLLKSGKYSLQKFSLLKRKKTRTVERKDCRFINKFGLS